MGGHMRGHMGGDWVGHPPEQLATMRAHLDELDRKGVEAIED